jgi:hypothetical protein
MKRSAQVALVLMSAATVGGAGYAMMPPQNCGPPAGAVPNAGVPNATAPKAINQSCGTGHAWGSYFHSGRPIFGTWNNSNSGTRTNLISSGGGPRTSTTTASRTSGGGTTRGGFGGTSTALASRGG